MGDRSVSYLTPAGSSRRTSARRAGIASLGPRALRGVILPLPRANFLAVGFPVGAGSTGGPCRDLHFATSGWPVGVSPDWRRAPCACSLGISRGLCGALILVEPATAPFRGIVTTPPVGGDTGRPKVDISSA